MERTWHRETLTELLPICEQRFNQLTQDGCDEDVAQDRTFDAFEAALGIRPRCYDPRDRLFENKLREAAERLENARTL